MTTHYRSTVTVPATHPSLPGHFPGSPVVPGVVLLDLVLQASEAWLGRPVGVTSLRQVKFHAPLSPEQPSELVLELTANGFKFHISRNERLLAEGIFTVDSSVSA